MKKNILTIALLISGLFIFYSCKKDPGSSNPPPPPDDTYNYTSGHKYNLNVIYFVPSDRQPNPGYEKRISEILLNGQEFFKKWMNYWGYGEKTFGLLKDAAKKRIKIILIRGKKPQSGYPYEGGHAAISPEINEYFAANPAEKKSDHFLILSAVNVTDPAAVQNSGVPYYGVGKWCYALDFPGLDVNNLGKPGVTGSEASKWIGGMLHELGHGLNLPHCGETVSEKNNPVLGTSLMGGGNLTYGMTPTFLTKSGCAILNNGQLFAQEDKTFYGTVNATIKKIHAKYENGHIIISGRYGSAVPVQDIIFWHRPMNDAGGYRAMSFVSKAIATDSFYISMPVDEFREKGDLEYELAIIFPHTNGSLTWTYYGYKFESDIPVIDFAGKDQYDRTGWQVIEYSSQETDAENGQAKNILDADPATYWHSRWSSSAAAYPHHLVVDMQQQLAAKGFVFEQRSGARRVKDIELFTSTDNVSWESAGNHQLSDYGGQQSITLPAPRNFRYFKIVMKSSHDGEKFAALAEAGVFN